MSEKIFVGVDGGGTKTNTCAIGSSSNESFKSSKTGSSNVNSVGSAAAFESIKTGVTEAIASANSNVNNVAGICLSMSGVDRPDDKKRVIDYVKSILPHLSENNISIHNDAVAALASGTSGDLYGVVVISGTGTIAYGYDRSGNTRRAAGWGPLLGDEGSGYAVGYDSLKASVESSDGRGPSTTLLKAILDALKLEDATKLIPWAYNEQEKGWQRFADLAPLTYRCATEGDAVALRIVDNAAEKLANSIQAVVKGLKMENETFPIILAGGNLTHENSIICKHLKEKLSKLYPNARLGHPTVEPEVAAALIARAVCK